MAKELPYFKFEPNAWDNGNIQMLSREDKGLFIDICSMYWSRLGDLPTKLVVQKLCAGNASALNPLYEEHIIEEINDKIFINFLTIQLNEFENISKQNSENAKEGWRKRHEQRVSSERNATAEIPQSDRNAIREDKSREEESREEQILSPAKAEVSKFDFEKLLALINSKTGRTFQVINDSTKAKYKARIKDGYSKIDIQNAINNASKDQYHVENGCKYLTPEFFSRSTTIDKYSNTGKVQSIEPIITRKKL